MWWNNEYYEGWVTKFAWLPTNVQGGATVWLEKYRHKYKVVKDGECCRCNVIGITVREKICV